AVRSCAVHEYLRLLDVERRVEQRVVLEVIAHRAVRLMLYALGDLLVAGRGCGVGGREPGRRRTYSDNVTIDGLAEPGRHDAWSLGRGGRRGRRGRRGNVLRPHLRRGRSGQGGGEHERTRHPPGQMFHRSVSFRDDLNRTAMVAKPERRRHGFLTDSPAGLPNRTARATNGRAHGLRWHDLPAEAGPRLGSGRP